MFERGRRLETMTWQEVRDAVGRGAGVVLPVGACEQHGPHMPLAVDAILPTELGLAVADELDLVVAPPITYGYRSRPLSGGGQGFPGTISLSGQTLVALVGDVLTELIRHGFRRLVLLSWHMENQCFVYEAAVLAHERAGAPDARIQVFESPFSELSDAAMDLLFNGDFPGWPAEHASIMETSVMLHLHPELVDMAKAVDDRSPRTPWWDVVPPPDDLVAPSGSLWKATQSSAEKGKVVWDEIVAAFRAAVMEELPGR